ncbi:hypothetical protein ACN28E_03610 [Archangium lansingense]|uniref:hypothetical protein n=1 Tax=Archangium lansingense TaxID=2995310 RepID=UPI003B7D623B
MRRGLLKDISRLVGLLLVLLLAGLASAEAPASPSLAGKPTPGSRPSVCENLSAQSLQGYKVPGRKPDSQVPWELFLGNASHRLIAYIYRTRHPTSRVYFNNGTVKRILNETGLGNWSLLSQEELALRPDITDVDALDLFEVKPHNEKGTQEGTQQVQKYLHALNRTLATPSGGFSGGKNFEGEILIHFAQGQYIWRLEWCTTAPGVIQYRWTHSKERFDSNAAAYQANQWVEISEQELKQYGGWVAQATEGMVDRRERVATLSGAFGVAIDIVGEVAMIVISGARSGEHNAARPGGKVLPFPSKPSPTASPARLPKASGM